MKLSHALFAASICVALTSAIGCAGSSSSTTTAGTGGSATENKTLSDLVLENKVGVSLAKGSTKQYTLTAKFADGTSEDVTMDEATVWNTSDPKAATVSKGLVTAVGEAIKVTISAQYKGKTVEDSFAVSP